MPRVAGLFTSVVAVLSSLACCCPGAFQPRPIVFAPPPIVVPQPPIEQKVAAPQPAAPPAVGPRTFDLIPIVDLQWDVVDGQGKWRLQDKKLVCTEGNFVPRVQIPYIPPEEYDFIVTFSQPGLRNGVSLIMPKPGGGMFFWYVGINNGNGYGFSANPAPIGGEIPKLIQANTVHVTTVQVRRDGVKGVIGGKTYVDHRTDFRDLQSDHWRQMKNDRLLGVACDDPATFHRIQILEITGSGRPSR